jgi:hypothetical protein
MAAFVVDLAWIWSNQLQVQRAADAGALAGVVHLPGNPASGIAAAKAESQKNGFEDDVDGVQVAASPDPGFDRRMIVTVSAPVDTFFMSLFGFDQVRVTRTARAEYVLPVPMGSPQNYYGVGEFRGYESSTDVDADDTGPASAGDSVNGGQWSNPDRATSNNNSYTTETANNQRQEWDEFGLLGDLPNDPTLEITGIEVRLMDIGLQGSGSPTNSCRILAELSWNGGGSYTSAESQNITSTALNDYTLGSFTDTWGRTWSRNDFSDSNFRVRLTWQEPSGCNSSRRVRLDELQVRVHYETTSTTLSETTMPVVAPDSTVLVPQNFWGASITLGGQRTNGDQYGPASDGAGPNADHDPGGYDYRVIIGDGGGGEVWIFDAGFCGTGPNGSGGWFGAGDHWINSDYSRHVTTEFRLYDSGGTPYDESDDVLVPTDAAFPNLVNTWFVDKSGLMGTPQSNAPNDCSGQAWHNGWVPLARGLAAGRYRLNVSTANPLNAATNAENGWSAWVTGGTQPRVYGRGQMVAYNNLRAGQTDFYLAQIEAVHAGKILEMQLFDPDASSNGRLSILSPDGGSYNLATFDYQADANCAGTSDACSATNRQSIRVVNSGAQGFNNSVVTITIQIPSSYGQGGLAENGWWKIRYDVDGGNDTTTWRVTIRGNPVHLITPVDDLPTP